MTQQYSQGSSQASQPVFDSPWRCASSTIRDFDALPSIASAPCAIAAPAIDRTCFHNLLSDHRNIVAFGQPCSNELMQGVHEAMQKIDRGFHTMITVSLGNVRTKLSEWFASKPLGDLSPALEQELKEDIERDAIRFIHTIEDSPVTLRLVLEVSSGFEELYDVLSESSADLAYQRIEELAKKLEYDKAYLFHCDSDDNMVNQIKSYYGATTLGIDPFDIAAQPNADQWFSLFNGEGSFRELAADAIARRDIGSLEEAIKLTMERAWRYQAELPGLIKPGSSPYRFLLGAPNLYFGAPEKLAPFSHTVQKSALHARPLIWASEPGAKRFLTLLDSPSHFRLPEL